LLLSEWCLDSIGSVVQRSTTSSLREAKREYKRQKRNITAMSTAGPSTSTTVVRADTPPPAPARGLVAITPKERELGLACQPLTSRTGPSHAQVRTHTRPATSQDIIMEGDLKAWHGMAWHGMVRSRRTVWPGQG
jgi:hypothetical protein